MRRWNSESGVERTWRSVAVRGKGELVVVVVVVRSVEGEGELVMVGREEWYLCGRREEGCGRFLFLFLFLFHMGKVQEVMVYYT